MNIHNNGYAITKNEAQPKGTNSPFILVKTGNGTIRRENPNHNKNLCVCGQTKGLFHALSCKGTHTVR